MSAPSTSAAAYRQTTVMTASPAQLVVMLYDGAGRFLAQAAAAMRVQQPAAATARLRRAQDILLELLGTLDHERGGEIAVQLQTLYAFCLDELVTATTTQDADQVDAVAGLLAELRGSWAELAATA